MNQDKLARMYDATRLASQGRLAEARALLQQSPGAIHGLPNMQALLSRLPRRVTTASAPSARPSPLAPGRFLDLSYGNAAGERRYKLYVPSSRAGRPAPLVVMLHGGTQGADDFAAGTRMNELAERHGWLVAYPEQSRSSNPQGYWNWFRPTDQRRGGGEASLIAGITQQTIDEHAIDARRVYVAGFSAGGAMAAVMAAEYPDVYAAAGVHSGLPAGAAHDIPSAFAAMAQGAPAHRSPSVPLIVFHGDGDSTVRHVNADRLVSAVLPRAKDAQRPLTTKGQVPGGHAYTRRVYSDEDGASIVEQWTVHNAGHGWAGGSPQGTYTDPLGPDASTELVRFFGQLTVERGPDGPRKPPATSRRSPADPPPSEQAHGRRRGT